MAWRFGAVGIDAVLSVIAEAELFADWMAAVPGKLSADNRWPQDASVMRRESSRPPRGRHAHERHLAVAIVEAWRPPQELVLRLRSGLGGWVRVTIKLRERPGGCLIEVSSDPLTASARMRYAWPARAHAEKRCADVAEALIQLATGEETAG